LGELADGPQRGAARVADQEPFGPSDGPCKVVGGLGGTTPHLIRLCRVPDARNDRGRQMLEPLQSVKRILRLNGYGLDRRVMLLQPFGGADEGAGGAKSRDEMRDPTAGLLQDLDRGPFARGFAGFEYWSG